MAVNSFFTRLPCGIREVILTERNPSDFQYLLQEIMCQREVTAHSFGMEISAANGKISVLNGAGFKGYFGIESESQRRGLLLQGLVFATEDFSGLKSRFTQSGIEYSEIGQRLIVPATAGQGAVFIFEAA